MREVDLIGKFCGPTAPAPILTTSSVTFVQFYSDDYFNGKGFIASYERLCRLTLRDSSGTFSSIDPSSDITLVDCLWNIEAEEGHQIKLNISTVDISQSGSCDCPFGELKVCTMVGWFPASRKHAYKCLTPLNPILIQQNWGLQGYTLFFLFLFKNIDCGYSLEPP